MRRITIATIAGTRPDFIKAASVINELKKRPETFTHYFIHTGQHYSKNMADFFFREFDLAPDASFSIRKKSGPERLGEMIQKTASVVQNIKPDAVMVVGDVDSSLAGALAAKMLKLPLVHIESGLRSFDRSMPEELTRIMIDSVADILFTTEPSATKNLLNEWVQKKKIHYVGHTVIDALKAVLPSIDAHADVLEQQGLQPGGYAILTIHRQGNIDKPERLVRIFTTLNKLSKKLPIVFPVHHTAKKAMVYIPTASNFKFIKPLGYSDFIKLMKESKLIFTDSGGIQEEALFLRKPCITLRDNTERPITITCGGNTLVGDNPKKITATFNRYLNKPPRITLPKYWDGKAGKRIANVLAKKFA